MQSFDDSLMTFLDNPLNLVGLALFLLLIVLAVLYWRPVSFTLKFVAKSLRRNLLRSLLTAVAVMLLVFVITLIWTVLSGLDKVMQAKARDFKAIVSERWNVPSQMPPAYAERLKDGAASKPTDARPTDYMSWGFYGGFTDERRNFESLVFFFCMEPEKVLSMMDGLNDLTDEQKAAIDAACKEMKADRTKVVLGKERLKALNKKVGERIKVTGLNYKGIDLELTIIGELPEGQYGMMGIMNREYLTEAMNAYKRSHNGQAHPLEEKSLALVWLKVPDVDTYNKVADQITHSAEFTAPSVKCETQSSGMASWLESYQSLLKMMRYLLVPVILSIMALVIAIAISIGVMQRRNEMAILKVLGFGPWQIFFLVVGEAVLLGAVSGFLSSGGLWLKGEIRLVIPIAWFRQFPVPWQALWWGPVIGGLTGLVGSVIPAWFARSVKVSEVFAKVA